MKKKVFIFITICICLFCTNSLRAQIINVYISEILYDSPLQEDKILFPAEHNNGEYFKLSNPTSAAIDISSWVITGDRYFEQFAFPVGTIIPAQGILLVAYKSGTSFDFEAYYHLGVNVKIINQSSIILCNLGEKLTLYDASLKLVDAVAYGDRTTEFYNTSVYASNTVGHTYDQLFSLHRTQVSYANGELLPLSITDLAFDLATPAANENTLANNTTPDIPYISPVIDVSSIASQNYIIKSTPLVAKTFSTLGANDEVATFQYFDGLGRPTETVQYGITPVKSDFVTLIEYDEFGRANIKWLPTPIPSNNGAFVDYTGFRSTAISSHASDSRPYTETQFEHSPVNRIKGEIGVGKAWEGHQKTIDYETNDGSIANFYVNINNQLCKGTSLDAGSLFVTQTTDEDKKVVTEFKNKLGQVVLKRSDIDVDTYYAYNDLGQLCCVIPPEASLKLISGTTDPITNRVTDKTTIDQYCYLYQYDERGNCITKQLPGCEPIYMVYDNSNRIVLSQDGNQRLKKQWTVCKYDALGRVLYTGIINHDLTTEKDDVHNGIMNESYDGNPGFKSTGYTWSGFTLLEQDFTPLIVNYYDKYTFIPTGDKLLYDNSQEQNGYTAQWSNAKGLLTGKRTYILDGSESYTTTAVYYDFKGQIVQTRATNYLGGYDIVYNAYDFTGKLSGTLKEHNVNGQATVDERYTYTYDWAQRPLVTNYYLNGATSPVILSDQSAKDSYDGLGRLKQRKRHNGTDIESFDYNIRNLATRLTSGAFEENLYYNTNPLNTKPCFNGNISYSSWTYNSVTKGYLYDYDNLNRLKSAFFQQGTSGQSNGSYDENFTYDMMGNISTLQRKKGNVLIDDLKMHYRFDNQSNQLDWIEDKGINQNQYDVKEYQNKSLVTSNEFAYDSNGNMIKDLDRNIVTIRYNSLNLPELIQFKNGNIIRNLYTADGKKAKSEYYTRLLSLSTPLADGEVLEPVYTPSYYDFSGTVYVGNTEYSISKQLKNIYGNVYAYVDKYTFEKLYNSEGYTTGSIIPDINNYRSGIQYNYFRRDHLGNNREVWQAAYSTNSGLISAFTVQTTQYYPSGLPWAEGTGAWVQNKKYNGKEFVEMHGYDTYDYGARGLYAAANIMPTIDPLAEKFYSISPYAYCSGNPMKFIDPSGMRQISWDSNIETADMNMPEYNFNSSGVYIGKINTPGENYGRIAGDKKHDPIYFKFADPVEDPKKLEDAGIGNAKVVFEDDEKIQKILNGSGVSDEQNHGLVNGSKYLLSQSNASSLTGGRMDYSGNGKNFIDTSGKTLYMTKTFIDGYVAHNGYNFGNFLWGAGAETLGIPEFMAKIGANINNYLNDPISKGTLDSPDDQFSISVGFNWRYEQRVKKIFNF